MNWRTQKKEQRQRSIRKEILSEAQKEYLAKGGKPIDITCSFDKSHPITDKAKLTEKIVGLSLRLEGHPTGQVSKDLFKEIPELYFVYVYGDKNLVNPRWRHIQVYETCMMSRATLAKIIKRKEKAVGNYENCDAYWLLVVIDSFDPTQEQGIPIDGTDEIKSERFKKIIVYKLHFNDILEINSS